MNELERFTSLFNQQVLHTLATLETVPVPLWQAVPADSDTNYLGARVNRITIEALVKHLCQAEQHWTKSLATIQHGQTMGPPAGESPPQDVKPGLELLSQYRVVHKFNLNRVLALGPEDPKTELSFAGRRFTVMGFLWAMYGHHSYHFGQIDLLLRQQGHMPPEFLEYPERTRVIA